MIATGRIHRLPQSVADAIAAGEVVERPASVVKELMENAIDAGASRIEVDVDGGGLVRIEVADDGIGIAGDDLELALMRHATSKISGTDDLAEINTLGFRGEALASIAAVSDLRMVSRTRGDDHGMSLRVRSGTVIERGPAAAAPGTRVEVCELFAATPARLRFLRATATEAATAVRVAADLALCHPEVRITCHTDGRLTLQAPGGTLQDALAAVYGPRAERDLVALWQGSDPGVSGAISAPHAHRGGRAALVLVVNGRRVHNRSLLAAVEQAYQGLIPSGRHPFGVVAITVDPASVDVNVHPTKREVRFRDERAVFSRVQRACWEALRSAPSPSYTPPHVGGELLGVAALRDDAPQSGGIVAGADQRDAPMQRESPRGVAGDEARAAHAVAAASQVAIPESPGGGFATELTSLGPLRALGQAGGEWMVAQGQGALVIVDPHAAHEKVLYTEILDTWRGRKVTETQLLLIPALVDCDPRRMEAWQSNRDVVAQCGFEVEEFGASTLRCTGIPAVSAGADATSLLTDLLDALGPAGEAADGRAHRLAALIACHSAVRFGDRIDLAAQQRLLDRLVATPGGMTCPHGRPTAVVLSDRDLRRSFRRPSR